jgi:hypothetical protein
MGSETLGRHILAAYGTMLSPVFLSWAAKASRETNVLATTKLPKHNLKLLPTYPFPNFSLDAGGIWQRRCKRWVLKKHPA